MREKKQKPDWYIAGTHYLTAGFIMPFLVAFVVGFLIIPFLKIQSKTLLILLLGGSRILAIWLGIMYSARYLAKAYIIKNKNSIVSLATIYLIVFSFGYPIIQFLAKNITGLDLIYNLIVVIIVVFLFYIFSKKYIKEDIETDVSVSK